MTWKPDICIYHFPCDDGFASAWVARKKWPDIELCPTNYGQAFPEVDLAGKNILIADFSFKPDVLAGIMDKRGASVVMLDHHKTAEADLKDFRDISGTNVAENIDAILRNMVEFGRPPIVARFDMQRSGAALTWDFCFPKEPMPILIQHIEDRDLWRMALTSTRAVSLYLRSYPYDFDTWTEISERFERSRGNTMSQPIFDEAAAIERFYDRKIEEMLPTATLKDIGKWKGVPVAHAPYAFASDLAHELLKKFPEAPFAAVVVDAYGARTYSLRSEDSREDVSEVARSFGGGGHRNAAGFRVPV